ncbi:MAG: hypothetical protein AAF499_04585 [Pseudomonadota bacterium]
MAATRAQWLDALGVDRWVLRDTPGDDGERVAEPNAVATAQPAGLTVLSTALSEADLALLDKMLAAIAVSLAACDVQTDTASPPRLPADDRPVLVLTEHQHETEWTRLSADYRGHIAVVAHPARLSADPSLKRPAWESLKRLGAALHAG